MFYFLPGLLKGIILITLMFFSSAICCLVILALAILKLIIPVRFLKQVVSRLILSTAEFWCLTNEIFIKLVVKVEWKININAEVNYSSSYLVFANHQSWVDIVVLQKAFTYRIPFLRFFIKKELMWVPFLNIAWWALDFPFLRRYSKEEIEANPKLAGKDVELARKSCEKFKELPASILIFIEGTRLTDDKLQSSPFRNLLPPKAGGLSIAMDAMGDQIAKILDVTIVYPEKELTFWKFLEGKAKKIVVQVDEVEIPQNLILQQSSDSPQVKEGRKKWINDHWNAKDILIDELKKVCEFPSAPYMQPFNKSE